MMSDFDDIAAHVITRNEVENSETEKCATRLKSQDSIQLNVGKLFSSSKMTLLKHNGTYCEAFLTAVRNVAT
jgi:hypothetical protein